jgi:putative chitinase
MPLSREQLADAMPGLARKPALLDSYLPHLVAAMEEADIDTPKRVAAFLAQVGHESADFRYLEEIWGPTKAQRGYDRRKDLGNTEPEAIAAASARGTTPGPFYKGHGAIQTTGYSNHKAAGEALGIDAVNHPELLAAPENAFRSAGYYWTKNKLNRYADRDQFETLTRRINGGLNGLDDRLDRWARAKRAIQSLSEDDPPQPLAATPLAGGEPPTGPLDPATPTVGGQLPSVSVTNGSEPPAQNITAESGSMVNVAGSPTADPVPAQPVVGGGPTDPAIAANKQGLLTKITTWATGTTGMSMVMDWVGRATGLSTETQQLIVIGLFVLGAIAIIATVADHLHTKWARARQDLVNVK